MLNQVQHDKMDMRRHIFLLPAVLAALLLPLPSLAADKINLPVPFVWEIPGGVWLPPWSGACEEASITMVENFYLGKTGIISRAQMKTLMWPLFTYADKNFGYNSDESGAEIAQIINDYSSFEATLKTNPTVDEIKAELSAGRPVISLHYGMDLNNPRHRYRRGGSGYHVMAIAGFDDAKQVFLVNDPELPDGIDFSYNYATIMDSLSDFSHVTKKTNGIPTIIFTEPKQIVRTAGGSRIYLIRGNTKYYISSVNVFKNHRWSWKMVAPMDKSELDKLDNGAAITK